VVKDEHFSSSSGLKEELAQELLDYVETEYFASALYELIQSTYTMIIDNLLTEELTKRPDLFLNSVATWDNTSFIQVPKLTTLFFRLQDQNLISDQIGKQMEQIFTIDEPSQYSAYSGLASQLLKMVFFGDDRVYDCEMVDLLGDLQQYKSMGDLGLGGGDMQGNDFLKQLLSGLDTDDADDESSNLLNDLIGGQ
jgi:hypothetical protein